MESGKDVNKLIKTRKKRQIKPLLLMPLLLIPLLVVMMVVQTVVMAASQATVNLGTADSFAVLAGSGITNTGATTITGDVGSFPTNSQTGFGTVTLNGVNHGGDAVTQQAKIDLVTAYNDAASRAPITVGTELGGTTLTTGAYNSASGTFQITGTLTLDAAGNPNAVFIFQTASTLVTASASKVELINGAQPCNVFWQVGSSATLGTNSTFIGSVVALQSITANTGASIDGRLLARNAAVTLEANTITKPTCMVPSIIIVKTGPSSANVGDTITYNYTVTNSGGLTLNNVQVQDNMLGNITLAATTLNPGDSTVGTQQKTVQASDLPGPIQNTATATGNFGPGPTEFVTDTDSAIVAINGSGPAVSIVKQASPTQAAVGDIITYAYTVTNTGGATITVRVYDDRLGNIVLNETTLTPGQSTVGAGQHTVQSSDLPGPIVNTATATGNDGAVDVTDTAGASVNLN